MNLDDVLPKVALGRLQHCNLGELKLFLIHDAMFGLLASLRAGGGNSFQAGVVQIRPGFVSQFSSYIDAISQKQKMCRNQTRIRRAHNLRQIPLHYGGIWNPALRQSSDFAPNEISQKLCQLAHNTDS